MLEILVIALTFAKAHYKAIVLSGLTLCAGVLLGRASFRCPQCPKAPDCPQVEAKSSAGGESGGCKLDITGWKLLSTANLAAIPSAPPKKAGTVEIVAPCPAQPPLVLVPDVSFSAHEAVQPATSEARTVLPDSKPSDVPRSAPEAAPRWLGPSMEGGAGVGVNLEGHMTIPIEAQWNPWGIPLGFEVLVQIVPATGKETSAAGLVKGRF
jgi:hypothetical protein